MHKHLTSISKPLLGLLAAVGTFSASTAAHATSGGELYTTASYSYGRFEARIQFAGGDGVVSSFFLWKNESEMKEVFWNELDLETVWADCELKTNALYGLPEANHTDSSGSEGGWCTGFHTYAFEWTPDYVAWSVDGTELRRETGADSEAFRDNAAEGMQLHFNTWPGDNTFGGNFTEAILPVHEYINWVQYSSYADGDFTLEWREDFAGSTLPDGWATGTWGSPKGLSTHMPENVNFMNGYAIISLTRDEATGAAGALPMDPDGAGPVDTPVDPIPGSGGSAGGDTTGGDTTGGDTTGGDTTGGDTTGGATTGGDMTGGDTTGAPNPGAGGGATTGSDGMGASATTGAGAGTSTPGETGMSTGEKGGCSVNGRSPGKSGGMLALMLALCAAAWLRRPRSAKLEG